jgi:hypothetical protein
MVIVVNNIIKFENDGTLIHIVCFCTLSVSVSSDDFCSDSSPVQGLITCVVFNILMFRLSSRSWFVVFLSCIHYLVLV